MIKYYKWVKLPTKSELAREFGIVEKSFRGTTPEKLLVYMLGLLKKREVGEEVFESLCKQDCLKRGFSTNPNKQALLILGMLHKVEIDSKES